VPASQVSILAIVMVVEVSSDPRDHVHFLLSDLLLRPDLPSRRLLRACLPSTADLGALQSLSPRTSTKSLIIIRGRTVPGPGCVMVTVVT
jgi:hypothetical protein